MGIEGIEIEGMGGGQNKGGGGRGIRQIGEIKTDKGGE